MESIKWHVFFIVLHLEGGKVATCMLPRTLGESQFKLVEINKYGLTFLKFLIDKDAL